MRRFSFLILSILYASTSSSDHEVPPTARILTPFSNLGDLTSQKIGQIIGSKAFPLVAAFPDSGRKHAVLEQESVVSKFDTGYGTLQQGVANLYHPKPIVDTIQPHDKYGNDGGAHRAAAVAAIGAFEGLSNVLNAAVEVPFEATRQISKKFTKTAAAVGSHFAGR